MAIMRSFVLVLLSTLTLAAPATRRDDPSPVSTDMDEVIAGRKGCASNALVFARGTFDEANLGVWVGAPLKQEVLKTFNGDIHVQGINKRDYPAELWDYAAQGGSESCADACAKTLDKYAEKCPTSKLLVSGWSQGALCAHKCVNRLTARSQPQVIALMVFGSENALMDWPSPIPSNISYKSYCVDNTAAPDVLCTATLTSGIQLPLSFGELLDMVDKSLASLKTIATNEAQRKAALKLPLQMLDGMRGVEAYFFMDLLWGNVRRWLVLLPHFEYESRGYVKQGAEWLHKQVVR